MKIIKIYWVCPLIEESEKIDLAAAEDRYKSLKSIIQIMCASYTWKNEG